MEDGDVHGGLERFFDDEAFRGLDVFEVDAAEGGFQSFHHADELTGSGGLQAEVVHVHVGEDLEEHALAFHDGLAGLRADVAEAENGGTVGHDSHEVGTAGIFADELLVFSNGVAGLSHAGGIGEREVFLRFAGLYRDNFQFAATGGAMIFESFFAGVQGHELLLPMK